MTLDSIGSLLKSICVHWPNAKKNYLNPETGNVSKLVAEEWYRRIGFLEDDHVDRMLEEYLVDPEVNRYPPGVPYFLGHKKIRTANGYIAEEARTQVRYRVNKYGDLTDQEGRLYADPDDPEGKWHYDGSGRICKQDGEGREIVWFR